MKNEKIAKIKNAILEKPLLFSFIFIFYIFLNIYLNELNVTYQILFVKLIYGIPYIILNLIVAFLISVNVLLIIKKIKEYKSIDSKSGLTSLGAFLGIIGGSCPGCFAGVFPAIIGIFGSTIRLSDLPLLGLEITIFSAILLIISLNYLTKEMVCKISFKRETPN